MIESTTIIKGFLIIVIVVTALVLIDYTFTLATEGNLKVQGELANYLLRELFGRGYDVQR